MLCDADEVIGSSFHYEDEPYLFNNKYVTVELFGRLILEDGTARGYCENVTMIKVESSEFDYLRK